MRRLASHADPSDSDDTYLPAGEELSSNSNLQNGLFNSLLTDDVKSGLAEPGLQPLCRLVVFANYLLMRVTLAVVTAKREEYGFDMFEALNTTGEPLTAIETFKPRVIQAEGLSDWKGSASKQWFDRVDAHLDREGGSSTDKRQSATSGVLIPFALRQSGKKIGKRLNEQRQYLKASYDDEANLEGKRQYVRTLAQVVAFMDGPWTNPREVEEIGNGTSDAQAAFGLAALRSGNHEIVVAPLARYHAAYRLASNEDNGRAAMAEEFVAACRTCAAFYALWRGSQVGTSRIDDVWRLAMQGQEGQIGQLARGKGGDLTVVPPVSEVQAYLRQKLDSRQLLDRDSWVRRASVMPIAQYTSLTRLLLFAASHDSVPDDSAPGLVVEGRAGIAPLLDVAHWTDEAMWLFALKLGGGLIPGRHAGAEMR